MITINTILDMRPGAVPKIIHLSQYDSDFTLVFRLHASFGVLNIESGTTAEIRGTKKSGTGYSAAATLNVSNGTVTVTGDAQMTAVAGQNIYEIVLTKNNKVLGSANFILLVERAALDADTITDETVLRNLEAIVEGADTATQAAEDAEDAADRAEAAAESLEIDDTLTLPGRPADAKAVGVNLKLLCDEIPNTTQTYVFNDGKVSQINHANSGNVIRTDTFSYSQNQITETRTLSTGESLTIQTNLTTLETIITYSAN